MARFEIRAYWIGDLAQEYYPDKDYSAAVRIFNKDLHYTRSLWGALQKQGYKEGDRVFTRSQVKTILKYLGEP